MSSATHVTAELADLFLTVAEKSAFLLGFPVAKEEYRAPGGDWLRAEVRLEGDLSGRLVLWVPGAAATGMAADLLGCDPDALPDPALADDAVGELLNVVAGQAATAIGGEAIAYRVTLPRLARMAETAAREALAAADCLLFEVDESPFLLQVAVAES